MNHPRLSSFTSRWLLALALVAAWLASPLVAQKGDPAAPTEHPFLWRIAREPACWLYGTIHVPHERVTNIPDMVMDAIEASDVVLTEIRLDQVGGLMTKMLLPKGTELADVVPKETMARLRAYLERKNTPALLRQQIDRFKVWAGVMTLVQLEMLEELQRNKPLDVVIWSEARTADKEVDGLESVEEQLGVFEAFSTDEQVEMLDGTLDMLEQLAADGHSFVDELVDVYLAGDEKKLQETLEKYSGTSGNEELEARFEKLLLDDRNERMVERMIKKMRAAPKRAFFFAVGAAHYPGEKGILKLLRDAGFEVERQVLATASAR
ncbi:MAG: TraB/GumN family protein [Planctomycetota bacterium]